MIIKKLRKYISDVQRENILSTVQYVGDFPRAFILIDDMGVHIKIEGDTDLLFSSSKTVSSLLSTLTKRDDFFVDRGLDYDPSWSISRLRKQPLLDIKESSYDVLRDNIFSDEFLQEIFSEASLYVERDSIAGQLGRLVDENGDSVDYTDYDTIELSYPVAYLDLPTWVAASWLCMMRSTRYGNIAEQDEDLTLNIDDVIELVESKRLKVAEYWEKKSQYYMKMYKKDKFGGGGEGGDDPVSGGLYFRVSTLHIDDPSRYATTFIQDQEEEE